MDDTPPGSLSLELTDIRRERLQERIIRAMVCDEGEAVLQQIIQANALSEEAAAEMVRTARKERLRIIRDHYMRHLRLGCFLLALGMASIYGVIMVVGYLPPTISYLGIFISLMGLALVIFGLIGVISAPSKKGSFADKV